MTETKDIPGAFQESVADGFPKVKSALHQKLLYNQSKNHYKLP